MSIPMYIILGIFRLLTVTLDKGLMSLKINTLFVSKQHPTRGPSSGARHFVSDSNQRAPDDF